MQLTHQNFPSLPHVTVLHVSGAVDGSNYRLLIEQVRALFSNGTRKLLLDMENCLFLSSAGLVALHSAALIAHQLAPFDAEHGWEALHAMADDQRSFKDNLKIINVQPNVWRTLDTAGLMPMFDLHPDAQAAAAACLPVG